MSCPNSDPNFDKMLANFIDTQSDYPIKRKYLFYYVCVVARLLLYSYVFINIENSYMIPIIILLSFVSLVNLYNNLDMETQWWSKKYQFVITLIIFILGIFISFNIFEINKKIIPIMLFASLFGGIFQSTAITFC